MVSPWLANDHPSIPHSILASLYEWITCVNSILHRYPDDLELFSTFCGDVVGYAFVF